MSGGASMRSVRRCGAKKKRDGEPCMAPAGSGTDHPGTGRCKHHGGCSPSGRQAAARQELQDFLAASAPLVDVDPIEALLYAVRRCSAVAAWLRMRAAGVEEAQQLHDGRLNPWGALEQEALDRLARFSKMALDAGVAERQVRIAERIGATIAQALEDALAEEVELPPATRARLAQRFAARLAVLERSPDDVEGLVAA